MAKKKKADQHWDSATSLAHMTEQFRLQQIDVLKGTENSAEAAAADVGIYLPHLALRYLFQRTGYPLERTMIIFGTTGSCKTAFMYWFYDLFIQSGGMYLHAEAEDKDTPELRLSLTRYVRDAGHVRRCKSMDDFMSVVNAGFDWFKSTGSSEKGGPGRRIPYVVGVDSLAAKMTEEASAKVEDNDGVPERRFADEARALSDWFKVVPDYIYGWPFALIAINHDKPKPGDHPGAPQKHQSPGGFAPNFYATYKILMERRARLKQQANGWEGNSITLTTDKCGLAGGGLSIDAELVWRMEPMETPSGKVVTAQRTVWNWDKATIETLYNLAYPPRKGSSRNSRGAAVAELLGLQKGTAGRYYARGLGVGPDDAIPPSALGRLLESNREILDQLEPRLGIHLSQKYRPGVEFLTQLADAKAMVDDIIPAPQAAAGDPDAEDAAKAKAGEDDA